MKITLKLERDGSGELGGQRFSRMTPAARVSLENDLNVTALVPGRHRVSSAVYHRIHVDAAARLAAFTEGR